MLTSTFNYNFPPELIAQEPIEPRDSSRLMVVDKTCRETHHKHFYDVVDYLGAGDLLVWNNTKVFKARLKGQIMLDESADGISKKIDSTDRILNMPTVEIFLLRPDENFGVWRCLAKPGRKLRLGMKIVFAEDFSAEVLFKEDDGTVLVQFNEDDMSVRAKANKYGFTPLPPYIRQSLTVIPNPALSEGRGEESVANGLRKIPRRPSASVGMTKYTDERYQTVYAKHEGSVAAPTAGFHFTPELIQKLKDKGVQFAEVTLHVGLGTFLPVKSKKIEEHKMHNEWVEITSKNADLINTAKAEGRRVVAVGTTTVRVLEGVCGLQATDYRLQTASQRKTKNKNSTLRSEVVVRSPLSVVRPYSGDINIFITPGFQFKIVDALITNFHLPQSTLLMLVGAFVGDTKFVLNCYQKAIDAKYRFYSFGDAMLIK